MAGTVHVRVPATSANLGPGFDTAGLALSLYDELEARVTSGGVSVRVFGEGAETLPRDARHLVIASMRAAFKLMGGQPPGLAISCVNRIPQSRGLGSSSAAICAGLLAARALVEDGQEQLDDDALLQLANHLEGHPDNVAPCLLGGLTFAWDKPVHVLRLDVHAQLAPMAFVPPTRSSTKAVRGLLPARVPFTDAAANAGRAALLSTALTEAPELLHAATQDWLHQRYRARAMPETAQLVESLRAAGFAAAVSGAGPSVLVLGIADAVEAAAEHIPPDWQVLRLAVNSVGATVWMTA